MKIQPPTHWKELEAPEPLRKHQRIFEHSLVPIRVIYSRSRSSVDGSEWHHVSLSRRDRIPTWDEVMKVKNEFLGEEVEAYKVLPKKADYVNLHKYCLHFFSRIDGKRVVLNLQDIDWEFAE